MSSIKNLCSVINNKYSDVDIKLTLFYLATKKQSEFIDMLYYILEDDTPLFFELFGGQLLKVPTKSEFSRTNRNIKIFLYLIEKISQEDPFKLASYKYGLYLDRIVAIFIDCYNKFIINKPKENLDLNLKDNDLIQLELLYNKAIELDKQLKEYPELNKRYTYSKRRHSLYTTQQEDCFEDVNYNDLLGVEVESTNHTSENTNEKEDLILETSNNENKIKDNEIENSEEEKQLSLF